MQQQSLNSNSNSGALNASLLVIPLSNNSTSNSTSNTPPSTTQRKSFHSNSYSGKIIESTSEKLTRSTLLGSTVVSDNSSVGTSMQKYWINPGSGHGSGNLNFLEESNGDRKSLTPRQHQQPNSRHNHDNEIGSEIQETKQSNHGHSHNSGQHGHTQQQHSNGSNSSGSNGHSNGHPRHNSSNGNGNNRGHHSHKSKDNDDQVIIHVYDETRQINRDFSCKRTLLVTHMKYFETFLSENDNNNNNYEDIDISVHCDVEIFDWLMKYIENIDQKPPTLDKSVVISILISSEFLQMERLVDYCLEFIMSCLSDIIKLPIDLSCISEKLVNRLAALTSPKCLAGTKDRKDKILNKLYKRRVELDFSRKTTQATSANTSLRSIASSLTCCRHCGLIYLENYGNMFTCQAGHLAIDFRGRLARRHDPISSWSLTAYLKSLHSNGINWDAIYWHVWSACVVFRCEDFMISALEVDKYSIDNDGIVIARKTNDSNDSQNDSTTAANNDTLSSSHNPSIQYKLNLIQFTPPPLSNSGISSPATSSISVFTPSLHPLRPVDILSTDIHELLLTQYKHISNAVIKKLAIDKVSGNTAQSSSRVNLFDFGESLYGESYSSSDEEDCNAQFKSKKSFRSAGRIDGESGSSTPSYGRGRSLSPANRVQSPSVNNRSKIKPKTTTTSIPIASVSNDMADTAEGIAERRSRSSSAGRRYQKSTSLPPSNKAIPATIQPKNNSLTVPTVEKETTKPEPPMNLLKSMPVEVMKYVSQQRGMIDGVWLHKTHPLQLNPALYHQSITIACETSNSNTEDPKMEIKRLEWILDIIREYDEKKMDRLEYFLASKRTPNIETQTSTWVNKSLKATYQTRLKKAVVDVNSDEYYKDKGRQSYFKPTHAADYEK